ncbi:hypothetical protein M413DRAFT_440160 [Hebeloma cylindrosporum]|uniref:Uncharacterized protein n=1 Tax=Hebeloma cylindrosporum TaxID=76867 RepID=A0A0C3CI57_HEBCY|nr:hypothetical protein M413DRAFT_440160 [Hebeloma cylindrosporum h7]
MLKRQRAPSPPLTSSSVPLVNDTSGDLIERKVKRRRTQPPVLDGASRGWARPLEDPSEDEEDFCSDDEVENLASSHPSQQDQSQSEYKSTNTMLRELHTLQQHRICFSSPSPAPQTTSLSSGLPHLTISSRSPDKGLLLQQERLRPAFPSALMEKGYKGDGIASDEVNRVTERYEGTNKFIGSLFLSRRRELYSADKIPNA